MTPGLDVWGGSTGSSELVLMALVVSLAGLGAFVFVIVRLLRRVAEQKRLIENLTRERDDLRQQWMQSVARQSQWSDLQDELEKFSERVASFYNEERREVFALRQTVESLSHVHQSMNEQARSLANALRGNAKFRGSWGESILERVLEASGLVLGRDYVREGSGLGLRTEGGRHRRPDVVVFLPRNRHLVIDAKVSLAGFDEGTDLAKGPVERGEPSAKFLQALRAQMSELARKDYASLEGLEAPDFVFMFVPLEQAFQRVVEEAPDLVEAAWRRGIMLISPVTLIPALRLVAQLWGTEVRQKNSEEIAKRAGILCDKLASCLSDLNEMGDKIQALANVQLRVVQRWTTGRGNLAWQIEELRRLNGITVNDGNKRQKQSSANTASTESRFRAGSAQAAPVTLADGFEEREEAEGSPLHPLNPVPADGLPQGAESAASLARTV